MPSNLQVGETLRDSDVKSAVSLLLVGASVTREETIRRLLKQLDHTTQTYRRSHTLTSVYKSLSLYIRGFRVQNRESRTAHIEREMEGARYL